MDCTNARILCSAALDGEADTRELARLDDHVAGCAACRAYRTDLESLHRVVRIAPAPPVPDLTAAILAATGTAPDRRRGGLGALRLGLVGVAVVLFLLSLPSLFSGSEHTQHLASFDLALAAGFVWVAARPARALSGFLPIGTVLVLLCAGLALADALRGYGEPLRAVTHSIAVLGMIAAWLLEARAHRAPTTTVIAA
jgi:predicted anti-sigma-YlaC factor YlaD